ncbi:hypothetical protein DFJ74DRAFT_674346 [Hyaloraphidium curvatum]|nr:hypothetical protein DFJ74DRAFT_674346 [Hyaloraphidium curvatum]
MSFTPSDIISFLNAPAVAAPTPEEDAFDAFLNIPFTFEDADAPAPLPDPRQLHYEELSRIVATSGALPKSATVGPNRIAATPATARAQLAKKGQGSKASAAAARGQIVPLVIPQPPLAAPQQALPGPVPDAALAALPDVGGFTPEVLALYTQLLANVAQGSAPDFGLPPAQPTPVDDAYGAFGFDTSGDSYDGDDASGLLDPETDKRQRNNAASARFRAKKKLRDMQLQQTAQDSVAKLEALERRTKEMEIEIKWLRGIAARQMEGSAGRYRSLRELYEDNGVAWVDSSLAASAAGLPAVSRASHAAIASLPVGAPLQAESAELLDMVPSLSAVAPQVPLPLSSALKRQLAEAQPRSAKRAKQA